MENAPRAFDSNECFLESLLMENIIDDSDDVKFNLINILDNHITFDFHGMEIINFTFLPEEDLHIYFKN